MSNFTYWNCVPGFKEATLDSLQGVEKDFRLQRGMPFGTSFPSDASFQMSMALKSNIKLSDCLENTNGLLVVSGRFKDFLASQTLKGNEFLPVAIVNHKGKVIKEKYFILNQTELQDCIDLQKSRFEKDVLDPELLSRVAKLTILENKLDPQVSLFRMKRFHFLAVARAELAKKILEKEFSGVRFTDLDEYRDKGMPS